MEISNSVLSFAQSSYLPEGDTSMIDFLYAEDSIHISKKKWGLYDIVTVHVSYKADSLYKAFMLGRTYLDSTVLYVADEDRNLSVSGETKIKGNAFIPQAGIRPVFVDGNFYKGIEKIIDGESLFSERTLPELDQTRLARIYKLEESNKSQQAMDNSAIEFNSFLNETKYIKSEQPIVLNNENWKGNIIIQSDSSIRIGTSSRLNNVICIAPRVHIDANFKGSIQVFAQDSISVSKDCQLLYPSSLVLYPPNDNTGARSSIHIDKNVSIAGTVLLYEDERSDTPHLIEIDDQVKIQGDLIAFGLIKYAENLLVEGATYCYRFVRQTNTTLYENYLIDINLDRTTLNPFFLQSAVWNKDINTIKHQVLIWLD